MPVLAGVGVLWRCSLSRHMPDAVYDQCTCAAPCTRDVLTGP
jgi:hypothetical protein